MTARPAVTARLDVRLAAPALVAWGVAGLALAESVSVHLGIAAVGCAVTLVSSWTRLRGSATWQLLGALVLLTQGAAAGHLAMAQVGPISELAEQGAAVTVTAVVAGDPRRLPDPFADESGDRSRGPRYAVLMRVSEVVGRGQTAGAQTTVLVLGSGQQWGTLRWGEVVSVQGRLAPSEPGEDVQALLVRARGPTRLVAEPRWLSGAAWVRSRFAAASSGLREDERGLLPGLVIGDTSAASQDLEDDMKAAGLSHLSAVSGSNVTLVLMGTLGVAGVVGMPRRARPVVAMVVLGAYVAVCRPEPSVLRAAVMGGVGLLAMAGSRRSSALPALGAAVVTLLVVDPWLARSPGFALSVLATLGLVLFARPWAGAIARVLPSRMGWAAEALSVPLAAQVVTAPVVVALSGEVSLVSIPANIAAAPLVAPATWLGVVALLVALVSPAWAAPVAWLGGLPCWGIAQTAHLAAAAPVTGVPWSSSRWGSAAVAGLAVLALLYAAGIWRALRRQPQVLLGAAAFAVGCLLPVPDGWPPPGWQVVACDVGQGDATVLKVGPASYVMVDVGSDARAADRCLDRLGVGRLDLLVLTHFHADHVGGLSGVLDRPVGAVLVSPAPDPVAQSDRVRGLLQERTVLVGTPGQTWSVDGQPVAWVVAPARAAVESPANNSSLVLVVRTSDGMRTLLTGDVEPSAAAAVRRALGASEAARGPFDLLKVPHHGSRLQDWSLLSTVGSSIALVSAGVDNDYGHPALETLAALDGAGMTVLRTDTQGDLAVWRGTDGSLRWQTSR